MKLGSPTMLSHVAYITHDTAATVRFYRELLGMDLVNAVLDDSIPSTGDPVPYFHSFFRMADGSTVAFFEAPELPPQAPAPHPAYDVFQHLALQVDSKEAVDEWYEWLVENDVDVLGPVDHKIIYSIYFHDPNGLRLEITTPLDPRWNDMGDVCAGLTRGMGAGEGRGPPQRTRHGHHAEGADAGAQPSAGLGSDDRLGT